MNCCTKRANEFSNFSTNTVFLCLLNCYGCLLYTSGRKRTTTEVVVEEQYFAESKASSQAQRQAAPQAAGAPAKADNGVGDGFYPIDESIEDDDLPF